MWNCNSNGIYRLMPETGTFAGASSRMYEFRDRQTVPTAKPIPRGRRDSKSSSSWVYILVIFVHSPDPSHYNGSPPGSFAFEGKARLSLTPFSTSSLSFCCFRSASSSCWAALRSASLVPHSKLPAPPLPDFAVGTGPVPAAGAAAGFTLSEDGAGVPSPTVSLEDLG